jgi:hypothetical protein
LECWDRDLESQIPTAYEVGRECILSHESEFTATGIWQLTSRPSYEGFGCRPPRRPAAYSSKTDAAAHRMEDPDNVTEKTVTE